MGFEINIFRVFFYFNGWHLKKRRVGCIKINNFYLFTFLCKFQFYIFFYLIVYKHNILKYLHTLMAKFNKIFKKLKT